MFLPGILEYLMPKGERCIFLEPGDPKPVDLQAWLAEQGFDTDRPIQHVRDKDGWDWWLQKPAAETEPA